MDIRNAAQWISDDQNNDHFLSLPKTLKESLVNWDQNYSILKQLEDDVINVINMEKFSPGNNLHIELIHSNNKEIIEVCHSYNENQIDWFKAGSSLNLIASRT